MMDGDKGQEVDVEQFVVFSLNSVAGADHGHMRLLGAETQSNTPLLISIYRTTGVFDFRHGSCMADRNVEFAEGH